MIGPTTRQLKGPGSWAESPKAKAGHKLRYDRTPVPAAGSQKTRKGPTEPGGFGGWRLDEGDPEDGVYSSPSRQASETSERGERQEGSPMEGFRKDVAGGLSGTATAV